MGAAKQALADFFGSEKDQLSTALGQMPGTKQSEDGAGNPIVELPNGQRFYVNKPGFSPMDVVRVAGKVGEYAPGSALAGGLTKGAAIGGRALAQALAAGGSEAAGEAAFGNVDPATVGTTAALGAGAELASPVIGAIASKVKGLVSPQTLEQSTQAELAGGASPQALAAQQNYNLQLTRGQKTGNFDQLASEETMRDTPGDVGGNLLREASTNNQQKMQQAYADMVNKVSGGQVPDTVSSGIESVQSAVQQAAQAQKAAVKDAYGAANSKNAWVSGEPLADLQARAVNSVGTVDDQLTPATVRALKDIGDTSRAGTLTLSNADVLRRRLSDLVGAAKNPTDAANVTKIKGQLDGWLNDTVDNALMQGDQDALSLLKNARGLRAQYAQKFQNDDAGGRLVQAMLDKGKTPEELAGLALGAGQVSSAASGSVAKAVKSALTNTDGELNQEAWDQFRGSVLLKLGQKKTGEQVGVQQLASNIKTILNQRPTLVSELYSPQEAGSLGSAANAIDTILPKGQFAQSSGTAQRGLRYLASTTPFIGKLFNLAQAPIQYARGVNALSPLQAPAQSGAASYLIPALGSPNQ